MGHNGNPRFKIVRVVSVKIAPDMCLIPKMSKIVLIIFQRSLMFNGVRSWLTQVDQDAVLEVLNLAATDLRKRGKDVKPFRI